MDWMRLLQGGVRLFRWFDIEVRIHLMFLLWILFDVINFTMRYKGAGLWYWLFTSGALFAIVLCHEFGHCFAARWVGGSADRILMWPLGGLAFVTAPYRPTPQLIVAAGGPLVNVIFLVLLTPYIIVADGAEFGSYFLGYYPSGMGFGFYLSLFYAINLDLLIFNLIPGYPMDGGRIFRCLLWYKLGLARSTAIAVTVAKVCAALMILAGLPVLFGAGNGLLLMFLGLFVWYGAEQERRLVESGALVTESYGGYDTTYDPPASSREPGGISGWLRKRRERKAAIQAERDARERVEREQKVDELLEKVKREGLSSLSAAEKKYLTSASKHFKR